MSFLYNCKSRVTLTVNKYDLEYLEKVDQATSSLLLKGRTFGSIHSALVNTQKDFDGVMFTKDAGTRKIELTPPLTNEQIEVLKRNAEQLRKKLAGEAEKLEAKMRRLRETQNWDEFGWLEGEWGRLRYKIESLKNVGDNLDSNSMTQKRLGYYTRDVYEDGSHVPGVVLEYHPYNKASLVSTYIHESFHAYVDHDWTQNNPDIAYAEEPIVEFGMLKTLKQMGDGFKDTFEYALDNAEKNKFTPGLAHYAFAHYLYKMHADIDWVNLLREVKYRIDPNSDLYQKLKDCLDRVYPFNNEEQVADCLYELLTTAQGNAQHLSFAQGSRQIPSISHGNQQRNLSMSKVFRAFPALKSMGENVSSYIAGQFSSGRGESAIFSSLFETWNKPELAGTQNSLLGPLVLEGGFGYRKSDVTLEQLATQAQVLNPTLLDMLEDESLLGNKAEYTVPRTRRPYTHQEEAFRETKQGKSILVSAGTGSGKTECFMYPILSDILNETPEQRAVRGVRAIILYPTNALIHSQEQRLIEYLNTVANRNVQGRPISFCMYNHGLAHLRTDGPSDFYITNNRVDLPRIGDDDEFGMPDIILTNFSMLEYILLRERDYNILARAGSLLPGNEEKTVFRHLVLDEAHTYTGSNATEIALQIRRVLLAMESAGGVMPKVQYYATSATFAGDAAHLRNFAKGLFFNVDDNDIAVIHGGRFAPAVSYAPTADIDLDAALQQRFLDLNTREVSVQDICNEFNDFLDEPTADGLGRFLWRIVAVRVIREWLCSTADNRSYRFDDLCEKVQTTCGDLSPELIAILLDVGSLARFAPANDPEMVPLLPTRWHSAFRKFEGVFACVNPDCSAPHCQNHGYRHKFGKLYTTWHDRCECGAPVFPLSFCNGCGTPYLMVQRDDGNKITTPSIKNIIGAFFDLDDDNDGLTHVEFLALDSQNGNQPNFRYGNNYFYPSLPICSCNYQIPTGDRRRHFTQTFVQNKPLFTSLVLEGLWPHLPEQDNVNHEAWPSNGRHILTFSDTRQNAAQLAPIMENTFFRNCAYQLIKKILSRLSVADAAILEAARADFEAGDLTEAGYQRRVAQVSNNLPCLEIDEIVATLCSTDPATIRGEYLNLLGLVNIGNDPSMQARKQELCSILAYMLLNLPPNGISIENAGIVECVYPGLDTCTVPPRYAQFMSDDEWRDFIYVCLQSLRQRQAFAMIGNNAYEEDFEALFDLHLGQTCNIISDNIKHSIVPAIFGPIAKDVLDTPANGECELERVVKELALAQGWINNDKQIYWQNPEVGTANGIHPIRFRIRRENNLYRCVATKKVVFKNIREFSPYGTRGIVAVPVNQLFPRLHEIVDRTNIFSCFAAEHTAQSEVKSNQKLEEQFRQNRLNLLSSTTTMEMGIDVGALASVMLANTPPNQANYMQRAGRAGRRGEGSSLIFTICNASPHDEMFFESPDWAFKKDLTSPEISFKSRTLMQRAVNAWLVRCICRRDELLNGLNVGNNPTEVYSLYGRFFGAVVDNDVLDWLHGDNLLHDIYMNPNHLMRRQIVMLLRGSDIPESFDFSSEASFIGYSIARLQSMITNWRVKVDEIRNEINNMDTLHGDLPANVREMVRDKCQRELSRMTGGNGADNMKDGTINYFVDHQYFPSHGLPLDVVSLNVMEPAQGTRGTNGILVEDETFKLTRNRGAAIRSYAPGNETVARGHRYMSLGILVDYRQRFGLPPADQQQQRLVDNVYECPNCRQIYTFADRPADGLCPLCSTNQNRCELNEIKVIKPEAFVTNKIRNVGCKKGVKNPVHAKQRVETIVAGAFNANANNSVFAELLSDTSCQVHILNKGQGRGFKYCTSCYRVIDSNESLPASDRNAPARRNCKRTNGHFWGQPFFLYHNFTTEGLMVKIKAKYRTSLTPICRNEKAASALGIALKTAACTVLGIEEREIDFNLPSASQESLCDVILYDTSVGGSGIMHLVAEHLDEILIYAIREVLVGNRVNHHPVCTGACPRCLVSYGTQFLFNDEERSPNRFALLNMIDYERIMQNDAFVAFSQYVEQNNLRIVDRRDIESIVETAQDLKIVLPYLSSDIFNSYLWHSICRRADDRNVKFLVPQVESEDDFIIAKELCRKFTVETVGLTGDNQAPIGVYAGGNFYSLMDWRNCNAQYPFDEENTFVRWVCEDNAIAPDFDVWQEPAVAPVITSNGGETEANNILPHRDLTHVMQSFVDFIGVPDNIDFAHAISWVYIDNYCTRKPAVRPNEPASQTKEAVKTFLNVVGAGHLLANRNAGSIWYCALDLQDYHGPRISWADIAQEDGNHQHVEVHDRYLRINLPNNKQFVLSLGKGFCCFVLDSNRYKKLPGSFSWYLRDI